MKKTLATAAFTAFFTASTALHAAAAQTVEAEFTYEELEGKVAAQTLSVTEALTAKIDNLEAPYAAKLAALENHQPGRTRMAENVRKDSEDMIFLAMAY